MSIGFQADSSAVGLSESVGLTFVARNDSSAEVKSINVEIKQVRSQYFKCGEVAFIPSCVSRRPPVGQAQGVVLVTTVISHNRGSRIEIRPDLNIHVCVRFVRSLTFNAHISSVFEPIRMGVNTFFRAANNA